MTDIQTELSDKIAKLCALETEIFSGKNVKINFEDDITSICRGFGDGKNFYETGTIKNNYHSLNINELINKAKPSKFGQGTDTLYDPNVRSSLEIMASELDPVFIEKIKANIVIKKLAPNCELRPYKLVIYQEGCFFTKHKDTIRHPKHIGTVSCVLNKDFSGGYFSIEYGGEKETLGYNPNHWIAIYGDVFHEVTEVTYGTRVSLLFDIYLTESSEEQTIDTLKQNITATQTINLVKAVTEKFNKHKVVVIGMFHEYSKAQLDAKDLKNTDKCIYEILKQHFNVKFEILKYYTSGYGDDAYEKHILDISNKLSKAYISFGEDCCDTESIFTRAEPHTGNDGGTSENLYLWAVFIVTQNGYELESEHSEPEPEIEKSGSEHGSEHSDPESEKSESEHVVGWGESEND